MRGLTLLARSAAAKAGSDSGTKSPFAFTVSSLPSMQKLHLSSGFQSIEFITGSSSIRSTSALTLTVFVSSCDVPLLFKISVTDSLTSEEMTKNCRLIRNIDNFIGKGRSHTVRCCFVCLWNYNTTLCETL